MRIRAFAARLGRPRPRGLVLMYHRVTSGIADPWQLCVSPRNFAEQLDVLQRSWRIASLEEVALRSRDPDGPLPVAITFDDGYADNLHAAMPRIAERELAATFFVVSGMVGGSGEFWWDELERLLLQRDALPAEITVPLAGQDKTFQTGAAGRALADPIAACAASLPWKASTDTRLGFFYTVWQALQVLPVDGRSRALDEIRNQTRTGDAPRESHRIMTTAEVQQLAATPLIDIGAHSVTHAALSVHGGEHQLGEMRESKRALESLIGRSVHGFAYPYGDLGPATARLAELAGFEFACTTEEGYVSVETPAFELPRVSVGDWDGATFARRLDDFVR